MQVIECSRVGGPEVLRLGERPRPVAGAGEVLIRVRAAGLNHADLAQRAGKYPLPAGVTDILGLEVAGEIAEVGGDAAPWKVGDHVCALLAGGGYGEYVAAPAEQCLRIPRGLDFAQAAVLPEAFATVWLNVFQKAALKAGEKLLVHGGSSGVGIAAIQLAHAIGASVYCTAGSQEKCSACEQAGASIAVNYREQDYGAVLKERLGRNAIHVIFDMVGGDYFEKNIDLLARDGRLAYIAALGGKGVSLDLVDLMRKRLSIFGSVLRPLPVARKGEILREMAKVVWPLLESGAFKPAIHCQFAVDRASDAHALMESHQHIGKLVLWW